jgi:hypothetical protein
MAEQFKAVGADLRFRLWRIIGGFKINGLVAGPRLASSGGGAQLQWQELLQQRF